MGNPEEEEVFIAQLKCKQKHVVIRYIPQLRVMGYLQEVAGDEKNGEGSRTFVFIDEGHTLGNALKTIISRYPDVDFCGYTIPHPTENKLHFRIQSSQGRAVDVLKRGLEDLEKLCDHTIDTFETEVKQFKAAVS